MGDKRRIPTSAESQASEDSHSAGARSGGGSMKVAAKDGDKDRMVEHLAREVTTRKAAEERISSRLLQLERRLGDVEGSTGRRANMEAGRDALTVSGERPERIEEHQPTQPQHLQSADLKESLGKLVEKVNLTLATQ